MSDQALEVIIRPGGLRLEWAETRDRYPEPAVQFQQELFRQYQADPDDWLLVLSFADPNLPLPPALAFWRDFTSDFAAQLAHLPNLEALREKATVAFDEDNARAWLARAPLCPGAEYLNVDLLQFMWSTLHDAFRRQITSYEGSVEAFIHAYRPNLQVAGRVFFHLVENPKGPAPFAFLATYAMHQGGDGASRHLPLSHALQEYAGNRETLLELLGTVYRAARESTLLPRLLESGDLFHPLGWTPQEAYAFLQEVPLYEDSGILCRIPNWWTVKSARTQLTFGIGTAAPGTIGMDALLNILPGLSIGGVAITPDEARALVQESDGLALIKNRWVAVDRDKLQQTLEAYEKARPLLEDGLTLREALALQLDPNRLLGDDYSEIDVEIAYGEWFEEVTRKLHNPRLVQAVAPDPRFRATLRPYQQAGLNWLGFLDALGFGAWVVF